MFGLFKEKVKAEDAAIGYVKELAKIVDESWISDVLTVNEILGYEALMSELRGMQYEIFISVVALELDAVMNISPESYTIIYKSLMNFLGEMEYGQYAVELIENEYIPAIRKNERDGLTPFNDLVFILAKKLELHGDSMVIATVLSNLVTTKMGTWKSILYHYKII